MKFVTQSRFNLILILLTTSLLVFSCGSNSKKEQNQKEFESANRIQEESENRQFLNEEIESFLKDLPSPTEVLFKLESKGILYNESLVNDLSRVDSYIVGSDKTAINLGIYASDVA